MKRLLTIELSSLEAAGGRFSKAWKTGKAQGEYLGFENMEHMTRTLTPKRWALVAVLQGMGPLRLRELARQVGRDVKRVHEDVAKLAELGIVEKAEDGKLCVPFAEIRTGFVLKSVA